MRKIEKLKVVGENGKEYFIIKRQKEILRGDLSGGKNRFSGPVDYILEDGRGVSPLAENKFKLVQSGEILTLINNL